MLHESLYGRVYNKDKTFKISENFDFGAKFNQEISIHVVNLLTLKACTSGRCNRQSEFTLLHFTIFH